MNDTIRTTHTHMRSYKFCLVIHTFQNIKILYQHITTNCLQTDFSLLILSQHISFCKYGGLLCLNQLVEKVVIILNVQENKTSWSTFPPGFQRANCLPLLSVLEYISYSDIGPMA